MSRSAMPPLSAPSERSVLRARHSIAVQDVAHAGTSSASPVRRLRERAEKIDKMLQRQRDMFQELIACAGWQTRVWQGVLCGVAMSLAGVMLLMQWRLMQAPNSSADARYFPSWCYMAAHLGSIASYLTNGISIFLVSKQPWNWRNITAALTAAIPMVIWTTEFLASTSVHLTWTLLATAPMAMVVGCQIARSDIESLRSQSDQLEQVQEDR